MISSKTARENAQRLFRPKRQRDEKGSTMCTVEADSLAVKTKTALLRAQRIAREATIIIAPLKAPRRSGP